MGGREMLCKLNYDALYDIFGDRLQVLELSEQRVTSIKSIIRAFRGHINGLSDERIDWVLEKLQQRKIDQVFVDGSNLGELARCIKTSFPEVRICTFFHNVEARFFMGALRQLRTARALGVLIANYMAERKSVRFSDKIICLNERDSKQLHRLYGRAATNVSSMALEDKLPQGNAVTENVQQEGYALFVGGGFYANRAGIVWFVTNVAPCIQVKTCIVGRGMEDLRSEYELEGKVEFVGPVDNLAPWYRNAHFVIAPIFDGSGMKTKIAEALMFGKKILATPEAFVGYEDVADRAGLVCLTADDFVAAIRRAQELPLQSFDPELRAIYEEKYSFVAARERMQRNLSEGSLP